MPKPEDVDLPLVASQLERYSGADAARQNALGSSKVRVLGLEKLAASKPVSTGSGFGIFFFWGGGGGGRVQGLLFWGSGQFPGQATNMFRA